MTPTERARQHDAAAFDAELKAVAMIKRKRGDYLGAQQLEKALICGESTEETDRTAKRFVAS